MEFASEHLSLSDLFFYRWENRLLGNFYAISVGVRGLLMAKQIEDPHPISRNPKHSVPECWAKERQQRENSSQWIEVILGCSLLESLTRMCF